MPYPGGKSGAGVYQTLINLMPPHDVYVEPFLGAGAVMRLKRPAALNIGIDLDPGVIAAWRVAGSGRAEFADAAGSPGLSRGSARAPSPLRTISAELAKSSERSRTASAELAKSSDLISRNSAMLDPASLKLPGGPGEFEFWEADAISSIARSTERLWCSLARGPNEKGLLLYLDPPYLHSTRKRADLYRFEMTNAQHLELLSLIRDLPCMVMISGYSSPMYAKALKCWNATCFQAATRGKPAAEWIWYNFDRPVELHDYRFLGEDFRERERIKRKKQRWIARLEKMPLLERQALLAAIGSSNVKFAGGGLHRRS